MDSPVVHFDIMGSDGKILEEFYAGLFGWQVLPVPEMAYATVDTHGGRGINGGIGTAPDGAGFVTFYVEVPDPQATLDRAAELGGGTMMPVTEIPGVVTWGQLADPAGNRVGVVQSVETAGAAPVSAGDGVPVSWFEVLGPDPSALVDFYTALFGWKTTRGHASADLEYHEVHVSGGRGIGGGIGSAPTGQPMVTVYSEVDDPQAYLDRAEKLGGRAAMPPTPVGERLVVAAILDPQGNWFGLYRSGRG